MTSEYGFQVDLETRFELYLTLDVEGMHEHLFGSIPDEGCFPPATGLASVSTTRRGLREIEQEVTPLKMHMATESGYEDSGFCWGSDVVEPLRDVGEWFEYESLYGVEERGQCTITEHDVPYDVALESTGGMTVSIEYTANDRSADDYLCRIRLIYGVPWNEPKNQNPAVTVISHEVPESVNEVLNILELAFRKDPVQDIPICLFDEFNDHDDPDSDQDQ